MLGNGFLPESENGGVYYGTEKGLKGNDHELRVGDWSHVGGECHTVPSLLFWLTSFERRALVLIVHRLLWCRHLRAASQVLPLKQTQQFFGEGLEEGIRNLDEAFAVTQLHAPLRGGVR